MREMLHQWDFVVGAYAVTIVAIVALAGWCWLNMRQAEARRDRLRGENRHER